MTPSAVHVVGSVNLDYVVSLARLPRPGETVGGARIAHHPGGKGANQALAAARAGASVTLTAAVGADDTATEALALLRAEPRVALDIRTTGEPTGRALVLVEDSGENEVVVIDGANASLAPEHLPQQITSPVTLVQGEISVDSIAAALARSRGLRILNPAPAVEAVGPLLAGCDVVIVNQTEYQTLERWLVDVTGWIVTTLGASGARLERDGETLLSVSPPAVVPVDTVGAGDAFCGALAALLAEGLTMEQALAWATCAGALATRRTGAQPSLPSRNEIVAALASQSPHR